MYDSSEMFDQVDQALKGVEAHVEAAEAQGILCGMLSFSPSVSQATWIAQVLEGTSPKGDAAKACLQALVMLFQRTRTEMDDDALGFQLVLPADSAPLSERSMALGQWCEGYLLGFGAAAPKPEKPMLPEVREALQDFIQITQMEPEPVAEEDNEVAYAELVEYVRMAVLMIKESLRPAIASKIDIPEGSTLH